jgi:hypothetical protein
MWVGIFTGCSVLGTVDGTAPELLSALIIEVLPTPPIEANTISHKDQLNCFAHNVCVNLINILSKYEG